MPGAPDPPAPSTSADHQDAARPEMDRAVSFDDDLPPLSTVSTVLYVAGGSLLVALGLLGWLIPIVPGWPLLIPGIAMLSRPFPLVRRYLHKLRVAIRHRWNAHRARRMNPPR